MLSNQICIFNDMIHSRAGVFRWS